MEAVDNRKCEYCDNGVINTCVDNRRRWLECGCKRFVSKGIDLSDANVVKEAEKQFLAAVDATLVNEQATQGGGDPSPFPEPDASPAADVQPDLVDEPDQPPKSQSPDAPAGGKKRKARSGSKA